MGALRHKWFMVIPCLSSLGAPGTHLCKLTNRKTQLMRKIYIRKSRREGKYRRRQTGRVWRPRTTGTQLHHPQAASSKWWFSPGVCHSLKSTGQPLHVQKYTVEFPLWDRCGFHYGNNGVTGANCSRWRSSWFCFDDVTWYAMRTTLTHAHTVEEITKGRMSETKHVQLWEVQKQLSLRVIMLSLPVFICLQCA